MRENINNDLLSIFNKDKRTLKKILNYRINTTKKEIKKLDRDYHYLKDKKILEEKRVLKKKLEIYRKIIRILFYKNLDKYLKKILHTPELKGFKIVMVKLVLENNVEYDSVIVKQHIETLNKIINSITVSFKDNNNYPIIKIFNIWSDFISEYKG